jgi:hypothetical protein
MGGQVDNGRLQAILTFSEYVTAWHNHPVRLCLPPLHGRGISVGAGAGIP